jgi:hypothetical protein
MINNGGLTIPTNNLTLESTTKSVIINGGETANYAIQLTASHGGIELNAGGTAGVLLTTTNNIGITGVNIGITATNSLSLSAATVDIGGNLAIDNLTIGNSDNTINYLYLKNSSSNTKHWRIYVDASGNLNFDKYNGTTWVNKSSIA